LSTNRIGERSRTMERPLSSPAVPESRKVDLIAQIRDGMEVYDHSGKKVGTVDGLYGGTLGDSSPPPPEGATVVTPAAGGQPAPIVAAAASAKVPFFDDADNEFPREMRERLEHDGFIRVDFGFLRHHRYALREQIDSVAAGSVTLNVLAEDLIKH